MHVSMVPSTASGCARLCTSLTPTGTIYDGAGTHTSARPSRFSPVGRMTTELQTRYLAPESGVFLDYQLSWLVPFTFGDLQPCSVLQRPSFMMT
jgi:hypothetical protein